MTGLLHIVAGPTASGKTAFALALARQAPSVVINADALQLYDGLPILTAQPKVDERASVPHALFAVLAPDAPSSVGLWLSMAERALEKALEQGKKPIVVGGTGLYFRALFCGLAEIPSIPDSVRQDTRRLYEECGHDAFRLLLAARDPQSAERIKPNDRQRLMRAYEVVVHTGKPLGAWHKEKTSVACLRRFQVEKHLFMPDRAELYARCDARFLAMMDAGALDEARAILTRNPSADWPVLKALGARELVAHVQGRISLDEAIAKAQQSTRNYAKRQVTWFKNQEF